MKYREIISLLSFKESFKVSVVSSLGFCIITLLLGSIIILFGGNSPVTLGGEEVAGLKGFLVLLLFMPFYFIFFVILQFVILGIGLWIMRLIFKLKKSKPQISA